jgi:hypothetical protein
MDKHTFEDDLTSTVPRADPQFQDQLEAAFLERIRQEKQQMYITTQQRRGAASLRFSLTGLAAVLALVIVGILGIYASQSEPESDQAAVGFQSTATESPIQLTSTRVVGNATGTAAVQNLWTATPTPKLETLSPIQMTATTVVLRATCVALPPQVSFVTETPTAYPTNTPFPTGSVVPMESTTPYLIPNMESSGTPGYPVPVGGSLSAAIPELRLVYIAAHDIPNGAIVTQADFIPTYWPADSVPSDHLMFVIENVQVTRDIPRWQPILNSDLAISVVQ